ncbi:hypothetical protein PN416_10735 [Halorubrum ezzemoulense]|uniref:DUF7555 family protein n=1 Tax=Halorubrum ezzemoulense TaxID=337243 RepID=UPI00233039D7|nr:hypothetical protein [Halorubrum ezzemoulense]MDB2272660.1 hypothetical protein [Halorubrum ezzemoulense]MDB9280483.1 hypothetical protein [Halorubrum ezzemoulense]MDB9283910.1 hypothetical protein [Halorubrum ezzemoulense]
MSTDRMSPVAVFLSKTIDGVVYAVITAGAASLVGLAVGALFAEPLVVLKYLLFVGGFLQVGVGIAQLWPSDPSDVRESAPDEVSRTQRVVNRLSPTRCLGLPVGRYFALGTKRFLSGLAILLVSFGLEAVLGV